MITHDIKNSFILARKYVERCYITVCQDGHVIQAFTECEGKKRVTDWGGTSSAINLLHLTGDSGSEEIQNKYKPALLWLLTDQGKNGSWEAAEMQCCEATAAVVSDLFSASLINKKRMDKALKYIQSCFDDNMGCFSTYPNAKQNRHIYTTYLATKALFLTNSFNEVIKQKEKIIKWVSSSQAIDGMWGMTPECLEGDVSHTIFALNILLFCGISIKELKKYYSKQITWLTKQIKKVSTVSGAFSYEATEAYSESTSDKYGEYANILKSYHFNTALLCLFFLKLKKYDMAYRIIKKLIELRAKQDGWGLNGDNKLFVWATQQAIECMHIFETSVLKNKTSLWIRIKSIIYSIPFFWIKLLTVIALIPVSYWLLHDAHKGADLILSIVAAIIPWLIKKDD